MKMCKINQLSHSIIINLAENLCINKVYLLRPLYDSANRYSAELTKKFKKCVKIYLLIKKLKLFMDESKPEVRPSLDQPWVASTSTTPPTEPSAILATPTEINNEHKVEISNQAKPDAMPSTPSYIDPNSKQPYAKIPMDPEVYREPDAVTPIINEPAQVYSAPKDDEDLTMTIPPRDNSGNWLEKTNSPAGGPKPNIPTEKPIIPSFDSNETTRRLDIDSHLGPEKTKLLTKIKRRAQKLIQAINELSDLPKTDPETKNNSYNQLGGSDQPDGPASAF